MCGRRDCSEYRGMIPIPVKCIPSFPTNPPVRLGFWVGDLESWVWVSDAGLRLQAGSQARLCAGMHTQKPQHDFSTSTRMQRNKPFFLQLSNIAHLALANPPPHGITTLWGLRMFCNRQIKGSNVKAIRARLETPRNCFFCLNRPIAKCIVFLGAPVRGNPV